ncbi:hypothetical protein [Pseudofrankia inefficax]|uniref:Uncharacterized protein n=1 Tax=Pseudofrankia inefficax (strain DSM 45817 / CECT 9037 / DDB 130130 / EuI1c) TaxID=298654 RepID=E3JCH0_PSEI1|nr:hypothetical protein [Pseudofrankia inefficax]ADP78666.1 hypothetical protein FraEuI1c_0588 [Pseudofrankia inefficax]
MDDETPPPPGPRPDDGPPAASNWAPPTGPPVSAVPPGANQPGQVPPGPLPSGPPTGGAWPPGLAGPTPWPAAPGGQAAGGPAGQAPMPLGPPAPQGRRRGGRVVALRVLGGLGALLVAGAVRFGIHEAIDHSGHHGSSPSSSAASSTFTVGGCVKITQQPRVLASNPVNGELKSAPEYGPVGCGDTSAYAKITALDVADAATAAPFGGGTSSVADVGCPQDTDEIVTLTNSFSILKRTGCLRNLAAPHPGDAGGGGGLIRAGDCLQVFPTYTNNLAEVPCTDQDWTVDGVTLGKEWFGKITARTAAKAQCGPDATYAIRIDAKSDPILCVAKAGGWLPGAGECVDSNTFSAGRPPERRACTDQYLATQIVALVPAGGACPAGSQPARTTSADPESGWIPTVCARPVD